MQRAHDSHDTGSSDLWFVTNGVVAVGPVSYELVLRGVAYGRIPAGSFVTSRVVASVATLGGHR